MDARQSFLPLFAGITHFLLTARHAEFRTFGVAVPWE
jgi:hypothetical protein